MIRQTILPIALALATSACATASEPPPKAPPPPTPPQAACDAAKAQFAVGQNYSEALAGDAMRAAGAERVRKIDPDRVYTQEYMYGRLNIDVSAMGVVTAVRCG